MNKLFLISIGSLVACASEPRTPQQRFAAMLSAQRYDMLPTLLTDLQTANTEHPNDPEIELSLGLANLWGVAEVGRDPKQLPQTPTYGMNAVQYLTAAQQLSPADLRIDGWLGAVLISAGAATHNSDLMAQGQHVLDAGIAGFPEFNLFVRALVFQSFPTAAPQFQTAIDAYYQNVDACLGTTIDRDNPDISAFANQVTTVGSKRVCWDSPKAPYNFEGFFLHMGDALLKAGKHQAALAAYRDAKLLPSFHAWPFRALLDDRIATIDARAALYADADPSNDPKLAGETEIQCASCHATR